MKVGDLVKNVDSGRMGVVSRVFMHKLWQTNKMGKQVKWNTIVPQPFAEVLWAHGKTTKMPQEHLEVVNESR